MNVMMLTAGEGTRLRPHTLILPKPAIPFLNVPLYSYSLNFLSSITVKKVVMNTYHLPEKLKSVVSREKHPYPIHFSEEKTLLGSGGGIGHAKSFFESQGDFILMNGDEVLFPHHADQLSRAIEAHKSSGAIATLLVMDHDQVGTKFGGVWVDKNFSILGFGKQKWPNSEKGYHYVGVAIFSDRIFSYIDQGESNILYDGLTAALRAGEKAQTVKLFCDWFETGSEVDFKLATKQCLKILSQPGSAKAQYLSDLLKQRAPTSEFSINGSNLLLIDETVSVDKALLTGYNVLGKNVTLKKGMQLKNSILGPGVQIKNADKIEDQLIIDEQGVF